MPAPRRIKLHQHILPTLQNLLFKIPIRHNLYSTHNLLHQPLHSCIFRHKLCQTFKVPTAGVLFGDGVDALGEPFDGRVAFDPKAKGESTFRIGVGFCDEELVLFGTEYFSELCVDLYQGSGEVEKYSEKEEWVRGRKAVREWE